MAVRRYNIGDTVRLVPWALRMFPHFDQDTYLVTHVRKHRNGYEYQLSNHRYITQSALRLVAAADTFKCDCGDPIVFGHAYVCTDHPDRQKAVQRAEKLQRPGRYQPRSRELAQAVLVQHAAVNLSHPGWEELLASWTPDDLKKHLGQATTVAGAVRKLEPLVNRLAQSVKRT